MKEILEKLLKPRTLYTAMFFGVAVYLFATGREIPSLLQVVVSSLLGFYYGEKAVKMNGAQK